MSEFRIQQCLGRGGFGEVYKAVMSRGGGVEVDVAVKVLRPDLDPDSQGVKRLKDEGNLLGRLTHPTILRVYGMVEVEGRSALVTEYVPGDDLGRLVRADAETVEPGSGIPARAGFEIIAQVAAALDAAWSWPSVGDGKPLHLVHRDIKPDNIRIDPHGSVKLLDFGISLASSVRREAHTSVNTIMGSTQYLAPERLVMQEVGPESDVFALGCTLFEVLTGEALFARKSMRQMYMLMVDEQRFEEFVAERCGSVRDRLGGDRAVALIRAMTAWRKQNRPTAAEVAARCDMISDSTPGPSLGQWCRSRKWPAPPTIEGPLEGHSFVASQPLAEDAATHALRPPGQLDRVQTRASLEDTSGPITSPLPPPDETTDGGLRTEEQRPSVMGELGHDPNTDEAEASRSAAAEGPLPWSEAEMVALWSEHEPTRRIEREEIPPEVDTSRLPQLLRQRPDEVLPDDDADRETPVSAETRRPADELRPEPLPPGLEELPARPDESSTTTEAPAAVPAPPPAEEVPAAEPRTAPIELPPILGDVRTGPVEVPPEAPPEPVRKPGEDPTVRVRRASHTGLRVGGRRERTTPIGADRDPTTGPIPDGGAEPTLRLLTPLQEQTVELPPDAQEHTLPGLDAPRAEEPPSDASWAVDEVHRPLGPEPVESSDPDDANTDADGMPAGRDLRPSERDLIELPVVPAPAPAPVPARPQRVSTPPPAPAAAEPTAPPARAPSQPGAAPRKRRPAPRVDNRRLIAVGASSFAGLLIGMVMLLLILGIVFAIR